MLSFLAGLVIQPSWVGKLTGRVRPNPYAPNLPDQNRAAASQELDAIRNGGQLVGSLTGGALLAGSEQDYWAMDAQDPFYREAIGQAIAGNPGKPASWYAPGSPGADRGDPTTLSDFDRSPNANMTGWGGSTRTVNTGRQRVLSFRINPPTRVTPDAAAVYAEGPSSRGDVFDRLWSD